MCRIHSEGTQHGCGHYIITREVEKRDCRDQFCMNSSYHRPNCQSCPSCKRYLEPDYLETVTRRTPEYCGQCDYWYKSNGGAVHKNPNANRT